jgi:hypothetical protein
LYAGYQPLLPPGQPILDYIGADLNGDLVVVLSSRTSADKDEKYLLKKVFSLEVLVPHKSCVPTLFEKAM